MLKKKNQRPTTNHVAQKQVDTSPTKKLNLNLVIHLPQKEEGNCIMKIIAYSDNPILLKNAIDKKIVDKELKTWKIVKNDINEVLYSHIPEQWNEKVMPKPFVYDNCVKFKMSWWSKNAEPDKASKGYITGRFTEILLVHFREQFTYIEIK